MTVSGWPPSLQVLSLQSKSVHEHRQQGDSRGRVWKIGYGSKGDEVKPGSVEYLCNRYDHSGASVGVSVCVCTFLGLVRACACVSAPLCAARRKVFDRVSELPKEGRKSREGGGEARGDGTLHLALVPPPKHSS